MKKGLVLVAALAMLSVGLVLAHGDKNRVMGNVTKVDGQNLDVKTADGHVVSVRLDKTTKFMKGKEKATLQDVKVGSRVVVHLMAHGGPPMAGEVLLPGTGQEDGEHDHEHQKALPGRG